MGGKKGSIRGKNGKKKKEFFNEHMFGNNKFSDLPSVDFHKLIQ